MLGVGAQKCGTTWLSEYLKDFDHVDTGVMKEYHVWDALDIPECSTRRLSFRKMLRKREWREYVRWRMQRSPDAYFDYFAALLKRQGIRLTGDVTPTYMALSDRRFAQILEGFRKRKIDVKVVLLMRDPFERCWSTVRYCKRNKWVSRGIDITLDDEAALLGYLKDSASRIRTNYHEAIRNLENAFSRDSIFYGTYEELFTAESDCLKKLAAFLDVPVAMERLGKTVNTTAKQQEISESVIRATAETFRDVYDFCGDRFPQTREIWLGNRYLC